MDFVTISLVSVIVILLCISRKKADPLSLIPGPFRLPIFGNVQFNFPRLHIQFTEFAKRYGEVYRIQILSQPAIVINSYAAFREAYMKKGKDFVGRPHMLRFEIVRANRGIAFRVSICYKHVLACICTVLYRQRHYPVAMAKQCNLFSFVNEKND